MIFLLVNYTTNWESLAEITLPQFEIYCHLHNYELDVRSGVPYSKYTGVEKLIHIKDTLKEGDIAVVCDLDVMITNLNVKIEQFITEEPSLFITKDVNGINSGVFIIKWNGWSKQFMQYLLDQYGQPGIDCEQNGIEKYMKEYPDDRNIKILLHPSINSVPYCYYTPSYGKIGYKEDDIVLAPSLEDGDWSPECLLMHLPGKSITERIKIFNNLLQ